VIRSHRLVEPGREFVFRWGRRAVVLGLAVLIGVGAGAVHSAGTANASVETQTTTVNVVGTPWPSAYGSLSGMAAKLCGDAGKWREIAAANQISSPYWVYPGRSYRVTCALVGSARPAPTTTTPPTASSGWVHPLWNGAATSSCYGPRWGTFHYGVDMPAAAGTRIRAAHSGTVFAIAYQRYGAGNYVVIDHGQYQSVSMHMRYRSPLWVGAKVVAGQTVGYVGTTGDSTGNHLHFEIYNGAWPTRVNPAPFMRARGVPFGC